MSHHRRAVCHLPLYRRLQIDHGRLAIQVRDHEVAEQPACAMAPGMTWMVTFECSAISASR